MKILLMAASALSLALSFPDFNLEFLAWIGLVPLFFMLENERPSRAFFLSYAAGVLFFLGTVYWLIHVTLPGMIIVVLYLAVYFGLFGLLTSFMLRKRNLSALFAIPAAWVALEWLRANLLTGFGWALIAHSQSHNLPFIQVADMTGAYGVSFLVVMVNAAVFITMRHIKEPKYFMLPLVITSLAVYLTLAYGYFRLKNIFTGEALNVAVIQGNIPQTRKWDPNFKSEIFAKYKGLTKEAAKANVDLIIWPETSVPGFLESDKYLMDALKALVRAVKKPLLVGAPRDDAVLKNRYYNSAMLFSDDGRMADYYDKLHLVPFGEYIPFKKALAFVERFAPVPIGDFGRGEKYTVFKTFIERTAKEEGYNWRLLKKVKFSCLICFEDIFPDIAREFVKRGAVFLVNMTNDAWFGKTAAAFQHAQSSVFRAVENRVNVVRAANTGFSCFIDQKGNITEAVEADGERLFVDGYKTHEIVLTNTRTFYTLHGDIFAYACIVFSAIHLLITGMAKGIRKKYG